MKPKFDSFDIAIFEKEDCWHGGTFENIFCHVKLTQSDLRIFKANL